MKTNISKITKSLLCLTTFLVPFYFLRFSLLCIPTNIFELFVLLSLISYIILVFVRCSSLTIEIEDGPKKFSLDSKLEKIIAWFFPVLLLIIILLSPNKSTALGIAKGWFVVPIVYAWLMYKMFNKENFSSISVPIFASLTAISIWAILQKIGLISTLFYQVGDSSFNQYLKEGRAFGPFESPNYLVMFIVPTFFLSLGIFEQIKSKLIKCIAVITLILPLLAIYFSGSRAGVITFITCTFIYLYFYFINHKKTIKKGLFFSELITTFLVAADAFYFFYATHFNAISGGDKIRIEIYKYSLQMLKSDWLFGVGLGNFQNKIEQISASNYSFQQYGLSYALHPHNLFLAIWLNLGIVGLALSIYVIVIFFKNVFTTSNRQKAIIIAAMFAILIHGFFDTTYFKNDLSAIFWLAFASIAILKKAENENSKKN